MNVLLLSMPDSFEHMAPVAIRMPNGALASLAGNVDSHHRVAIADLILSQGRVGPTVARLVGEHRTRRRRPVGDDVPARHRAARSRELVRAAPPAHASSPAGTIRASRRTPTRPARRLISWCAAKGSSRFASCCARWKAAVPPRRIAGLSYRDATVGSSTTPTAR